MTRAIAGYSTLANGRGVYGQATAANGAGVQGGTNQGNAFGLWGFNTSASGTGSNGAGNNQISTYLTAGSGGSFSGLYTGVFGFVSSITIDPSSGGLFQDEFDNQWDVAHWDGFGYYKIIGPGAVSTIVEDINNQKVVMHCTETPENLFEDYGTGQLVNGRVTIAIDPTFAKNILVDEQHPLKVFVQLEGDCNGVYVTNKSAHSFEVVELQSGLSNTLFSYSIVATRGSETYTAPNGQTRTARYDRRFEKAPQVKQRASLKAELNH
ncbi:hypothetical protein [Flavobacterium caeni]|uniref:Uncharacterized protein n=1 Tax=Flavobacterium caeni TaxID=490189 RepID=A0A1G5J3R0_9FLAO|nr:hypothetical protein [Flavobacterium caeni]SCY82983.1 hypothetical protein SAMN02927903_02524 [Flavobacterium caeni]